MKKIITLVLVLLMFAVGTLAILGSGGESTEERADRQWVNYNLNSEAACQNWCTAQLRNHHCTSATYTWDHTEICSCDGKSCD